MARKTLLIVYHSMTGGTEQMAQAAAEGARGESGVQVRLLRASGAQPDERLRSVAPALIVCTHAQTPEDIARPKQIGAADLAQCRQLGAALAAGLALGVY